MENLYQLEIEEALKSVGSFKLYHVIVYAQVFLYAFPNGFLSIHYPLSHFTPEHRCRLPDERDDISDMDWDLKNNNSFSVDSGLHSYEAFGKCHMYKHSYNVSHGNVSEFSLQNGTTIVSCKYGWEFDINPEFRSAPMEFSLVCDEEWKLLVAVAIFQVGIITGSLFASTADRFGRRPVFLFAAALQITALISVIVSWSFPIYCAALFIGAIGSILTYITAFIVSTEVTVSKWRNFMAISSTYSFSFCIPLMALMGYCFQDWKWFIGSLALLSALIYFPSLWWFPESPRWLIEHGRQSEVVKVLTFVAKMNRREKTLEDVLENHGGKVYAKSKKGSHGYWKSIQLLLSPTMRAKFLTCLFGWFVSTMIYFTITIFSTDFSKDRYVNLALIGVAELPGVIVCQLMLSYLGRPRSLFLLLSTCALSSISLPFLPSDYSAIITITAITGKAAVSGVFFAWYLVSSELFPTLQRSTGMSLCSAVSRFGGVFAPFLMYIGISNRIIPNLVLGGLAEICAILAIMIIPETKGVDIPDTVEEASRNKRIYRFNFRSKFVERKLATISD